MPLKNQPVNVICSNCGIEYHRPPSLSISMFAECAFICENCRCKDCQIVLDYLCECGYTHGKRSLENSRICSECVTIRERVANLPPELLRLRTSDMSSQESIYDGVRDCRSKEIEKAPVIQVAAQTAEIIPQEIGENQ